MSSIAIAQASILLVDDEDAVRMIVRRLLQRSGYRVVDTGNPVQALGIFAQRDDWDLLVTDLMMPHLKGWELATDVRRLRPSLPVLFISGYPGEQVLPGLGEREQFLRKPFSMDELQSATTRLLALQGK